MAEISSLKAEVWTEVMMSHGLTETLRRLVDIFKPPSDRRQIPWYKKSQVHFEVSNFAGKDELT
jgi:hypothetical protein